MQTTNHRPLTEGRWIPVASIKPPSISFQNPGGMQVEQPSLEQPGSNYAKTVDNWKNYGPLVV